MRHLTTLAQCLCGAAALVSAPLAIANTMTIPLASFVASGDYGSPLNSRVAVRVGAGGVVTGLAWDLSLTTSGQSRGDEGVICLYAAGDPNAIVDLRAFECAHASGAFTSTHAPLTLTTTLQTGPNVWGRSLVLPDGFLYLEAWDLFDDLTAPTDAVLSGSVTIEFTPPACPGDIDGGNANGIPDGAVTIDDLVYFLQSFEAGSLNADLDDGSSTATPDQAVTIDDLIYMLVRFENGC